MPIFEDELQGANIPENTNIPDPDIRSTDGPQLAEPGTPIDPNIHLTNPPETLNDLARYRGKAFTGFDAPLSSASIAELDENRKYPTYQRGVDLENIYGVQQSAGSQLFNSFVKFGATAGGIFVQSFAAIPNVVDAIRKGDFAELSGDSDGFEGVIDNWLDNMENTFPNYYTKKERDNPWTAVIPFATGSANFWGDKFLKNLGFTVGAIGGSLVQDAIVTGLTGGTGTAPLVGAQVAGWALKLNKLASVLPKSKIVANMARTVQAGRNVERGIDALQNLSTMARLKNGAQFTTTMLGASITEAGVESREGYRHIKEELTRDFHLEHGRAPMGSEAELIDRVATDAMNIRFGVNTGLLFASNTMLFGNLARNLGKAGKPVSANFSVQKGPLANLKSFGLKEGSLDTFEKKVATNFVEKAWEKVKPAIPVMISEGVYEEGGQFATEKGTYDYFTRKYKNLNNPQNREAWNTVEESIRSVMHGLNEQFTTDEGLQNMFIGALTGMFVTGVQNIADKRNKSDKNSRTDKVINMLNENYLTGIFKQQYEDTATSAAIIAEMREVAETGDTFKYQNLQHDNFFNFINSRSKVGAHEVTIQQLELLKDLDKEQFEQFFGVDLNKENEATVGGYIDMLIDEANQIDKVVRKMDQIYINPFTWTTTPETPEQEVDNRNHLAFESWKKEVAYLNAKIPFMDNRAEDAATRIAEISPNLTGESVSALMDRDSLRDLSQEYEQDAATLESTIEFATSARERAKTRKQAKKLRTLAGQASLLANNRQLGEDTEMKYRKALLDFENSGRDIDNEQFLSEQDAADILQEGLNINRAQTLKDKVKEGLTLLTAESGFKKYLESELDVMNQVVPEEPGQVNYVNEAKETVPLELGREYEIDGLKERNYKKLPDGRFEVPKPDGTKVYTKTEAQAKKELADTNATIKAMGKVTVLGITPNGAVTIEDGNGDIYDIDPSRLKGYTKVQSMDEFADEISDHIKNMEEEANRDSASVSNKNIKEVFTEEEGARKHEQWLFLSTTTESETDPDAVTSPHILRARQFMNKAKFSESRDNYRMILVTARHLDGLGLTGILEQSYKGSVPDNYLDIDHGWMAGIFIEEVEEDGELQRYYISSVGERIGRVGEQVDINEVIYQTVPTTDLHYKNHGPKYRAAQETEASMRQAQWKSFREDYFKEDNTIPLVLPFEISRGIGVISDQNARNSVDTIVPFSAIENQKGLIHVSTSGFIEFQGQNLATPTGVPMIRYMDTLEFLQNRKFNRKEAATLFEVLKKVADGVLADFKSGNKKTSILNDYWYFAQQVLYTTTKGKPEANQLRINIGQRRFEIGNEVFDFDKLDENRTQFTNTIEGLYQNINNVTLTKKFDEKFEEFYLDSEGELQIREWPNYQYYLLSPVGVDAKSRNDIPLTTNINVPAKGSESHIAKYAKFDTYIDMPVVQPTTPTESTNDNNIPIGDNIYNFNGKAVNSHKTPHGPLSFTGVEKEDGTLSITLLEDEPTIETIGSMEANSQIMEQVYPLYEKITGKKITALEKEQQGDRILYTVQTSLLTKAFNEAKDKEVPGKKQQPPAQPPKQKGFVLDGTTINTLEFDVAIEGENQTLDVEFTGEVVEGVAQIDFAADREKNVDAINALANDPSTPDKKKVMVDSNLIDSSATLAEVSAALIYYKIKNEVQASIVKKKNDGFKRPNRNFRLIGVADNSTMTAEDMVVFRKWHKENLPNVPFEVLENIIQANPSLQAWGVFEDGVIKFVEGGLKGTEYHEAFEAIWNGMLSNEEQTALLEEFRDSRGTFIDRSSGKEYFKSDPTVSDEMIKERLADDFADWRVKKISSRSLAEKVLDFFKKIIDLFNVFKKKSIKEDLFEAIDAGRFKESTLNKSVYNLSPQYRKIEGLTEQQAEEYVQDMTAVAAAQLFSIDKKDSLFNYSPISKATLFRNIHQFYGEQDKNIVSDLAWEQLIQRTTEKLRTMGITFDEDGDVNINEEETSAREYIKDPFVVDAKSSSPQAVKFLLSTLFKTQKERPSTFQSAPEPLLSSQIKGYQLIPYTKVFGTLVNRLSNTTNIDEFVNKLIDLADENNDYIRLFQRLGGTFVRKSDKNKSYIDFSKFDTYDWRLFTQFYQVFSKQFPDAIVQYNTQDEVYSISVNSMSSAKDLRKAWIDNIKLMANDESSIIFYDRQKQIYKVRPFKAELQTNRNGTFTVRDSYGRKTTHTTKEDALLYVKKNGISVSSDMKTLNFLNSIGISFTESDMRKLNKEDKKAFNSAAGTLYKFLGKNNELVTLSGTTLAVNQPFLELANLFIKVNGMSKDSTHYGLDGKRRGNYSLDNAPSMLENDFLETKNVQELKELRPELNDVYSKNSLLLKPGSAYVNKSGTWKKRIKVSYVQGTKDLTTNDAEVSSKLVLSDRYVQEINQNVNGNYYIIMPADSSTEWMLDIGNNITFRNMSSGRKRGFIGDIFMGYLEDEINLALDADNRKYLKNVKDRASDLRMFHQLLPAQMVEKIEGMVKANTPVSEIMTYVKDNQATVMDSVLSFVEIEANTIKDTLLDSKKVVLNEDGTYSYNQLDSNFAINEGINKSKLSQKELDTVLQFVSVNTAIANIEMHKVLFGDPYLWATKGNVTEAVKRIKSFLSPAKKMFDTDEYNSFLNTEFNKVEDVALTEKDYGYHKHKDHAKTTVFSDHEIAGSLSNVLSVYANTDVTDGFSWIMDTTYREVLHKNGQWSDAAEAFFQWQMAYTRQNVPGYEYTSEKLRKHDEALVKTPAPEYHLKVLKPIVRGAKGKKNHIDVVIDKFAQMPVFYSMVEGTNMEKLYTKMFNEKIDYSLVRSARKMGVETTHELYKPNGEFNSDPFNNIAEIPWKIYAIQVETAHDDKKQQTRGSQLTKIASLNLFKNGKPVGATKERQEEIEDIYAENMQILDELHQNAYDGLLNKLGIEELDNSWVAKDGKKISDALVYEMLRREVNENVKDTIKLDDNNQFIMPFEASPSYVQIKDIMYSMINKALLSPKMNGGAHVQVPVALLEKQGSIGLMKKDAEGVYSKITKKAYGELSAEEQKKVVFTNDTLKFYEDEDGKRYCEIMVPHWFKDKLKSKFSTDKEILDYMNKNLPEVLTGIAFRIPSQALSSIEVFKVKGFLPQYMGATVVVPAEITAKSGSDFDIDKLNMYLKSIYLDEKGEVRVARVLTKDNDSDYIDREATKQMFRDVFNAKIAKHKKGLKSALEKIKQKYTSHVERAETSLSAHQDVIDNIVKELWDEADLKNARIYEKLDGLNDEALQDKLREDFVEAMYRKALENEYYISLERMLTLPENFQSLISPVSDGGFKATAEKIKSLKGSSEIKNQLISKSFLTNKRNAFALGKQWIGIAAVNITGLSNRQKAQIVFDTSRIADLSAYYKKWIGDGSIQLPHNTVDVDGSPKLTISGLTTAEAQARPELNYLSDRFSGFATATVDVATDDYILDVFPSGLLISTAMFMEAAGMGEKGRMFLAQPIIQRYVQKLDYNQDKRLHNAMNIEDIQMEFPVSSSFDPSNNTIDIDKFEENISVYAQAKNNTSDKMLKYNEQQLFILEEFLKYAVLGREMFMLNQASNYDTSKIRNGEEYMRKEFLTTTAEEQNLFTSVSDIMDSTFLGVQKNMMSKAVGMMSAVFKLDQPKFKSITDTVLRKYAERQFISQVDFTTVIQDIKISYLDYLIQSNSDIGIDIDTLIKGENNIGTRLNTLKAKYPAVGMLQDLEADLSQRVDGAMTVRIFNKDSDAYSDNYYIGLMRELRDYNDETKAFYEDLIKVAILQGSKRSSSSIKHIVPVEDYSSAVSTIIDNVVPNLEADLFAKGMFERNNFTDAKVMPVFIPPFVNVDPEVHHRQELTMDSKTGEVTYFYTDRANTFPTISELGVRKTERKLMILDQRYNFKHVDNEFLKVPRIITVKNKYENDRTEFYDIANNSTISYQQYKAQREKGESSHYEYIGYQKVRMPNGEFLTFKDNKNQTKHVYKQIDLLGEGRFLKEYYTHYRPSAVSNGAVKVKGGELSDSEILTYYDAIATPEPSVREEYTYIEMKKDNIDAIKAGVKTITNRKEYIDNGTYALRGGGYVSLKLIGQANIIEHLGKPIVLFSNGTKMSVEEFAKKEGFASWEDFKENGKYSQNFIFNKQSRYVYNVFPVELSEEEKLQAEEVLKNVKAQPVQQQLFDVNAERPNFDSLPPASKQKSFTYAGIGSRNTPAEILTSMKQVAMFLATKGYTLYSGGAKGADSAFASGTSKKKIFTTKSATDFTRAVAREIHPNPKALGEGIALDLLARNTNQVFGADLQSPVDFVLAYTPLTKEGKVVTKAGDRVYYGKGDANNTGGTGQAIAMADMKGIPVINMADPKWRDQLKNVLTKEQAPAEVEQKENVVPFSNGVEVVDRYDAQMVKDNPNKLYIFGDNNLRTGKGGQAIIRDESNAFGISTKKLPNNTDAAFMNDNEFEANKKIINEDITRIANAKGYDTIVFPKDGIGTGLAKLKEKAPRTFHYLGQQLRDTFGVENPGYDPNYEFTPETPPAKAEFSYNGKTIQTEFPLSEDQAQALRDMIDFVASGKPRHVLQGAAGTGKTSLIGYLQKYLGGKRMLYMAPTHAATVELAFATMKTGNRSLPITVASAMSLDRRDNTYKLSKKADQKLGFGRLIVVDETSMLSTEDYNKLKHLGNKGYKVIFLGDKKQIPEVIAGAQNAKAISKAFTENPVSNLDVIHRTSNKDIKEVLQKVRDSKVFQLYKTKNTENLKFYDQSVDFKQQLANFVRQAPEDTDYIGYTNKSVQAMNKLIREEIFDRSGEIQPGDIIVGYLGYSSKQVEDGNLANSVSYTVSSVNPTPDFKRYKGYEIIMESKRLKALYEAGFDVPKKASTTYIPLSVEDSLESDLTQEQYDSNNAFIAGKFEALYDVYSYAAQVNTAKAWAKFYEQQGKTASFFKNVDLGGKYIFDVDSERMVPYNAGNAKEYYRLYGSGRQHFIIDKGIDFGHSITIHKSQGRTTKNVFFDANTIVRNDIKIMENGQQISTERQSLGYVGMSRASDNLFVNMGWVGFKSVNDKTVEPTAPQTPVAPKQTGPRTFKISQYDLTLNTDGRVYYKNGAEVIDPTLINKVMIAKDYQDGVLRTSIVNDKSFFVLKDNSILFASKENYGKAVRLDQKTISQILAKATIYKKEC